METVRWKKFGSRKLSLTSHTTNGMEALDDFRTDHPFVDWYKTMKDILNIFQKG